MCWSPYLFIDGLESNWEQLCRNAVGCCGESHTENNSTMLPVSQQPKNVPGLLQQNCNPSSQLGFVFGSASIKLEKSRGKNENDQKV